MNNRHRRSIVLTSRDLAILAHTLRFRMTTQEAVQRLFCPELAPDGVASILRRLREGDYLAAAHLYSQEYYYHLSPRGAERVGHLEQLAKPERVGRALDALGLVRAYGVFTFCCLQEVQRQYISRYEMRTQFSSFWDKTLPQTPYYLHEKSGKTLLGYIIIDYGHSFMRPVYMYSDAVVRRLAIEPLRHLIQSDGFIITILTSSEEEDGPENPRIATIKKALDEREQHVEYQIIGIPHLRDIGAKKTTRQHAADA